MNGNKVFLDTNIIIYILAGNEEYINKFLDKEIYVSIITELEVLSYKFKSKEDEKIAKSFFENVNIVDISYFVKDLVISIKQENKVKLPD
jgi:predicted nucleic acid-binding protein